MLISCPMAFQSASTVRRGGRSQEAFELAECQLDRIEIRTVRRQVEQRCATGLDGLPHAADLVTAEIVADDDVADVQRGESICSM